MFSFHKVGGKGRKDLRYKIRPKSYKILFYAAQFRGHRYLKMW